MAKVPFKDSRLGVWLKTNVPTAINAVENFVPAPVKGGLDIVKNLIGTAPGLTDEQKNEGLKLADDHELEMLKENDSADATQDSNITERWRLDVTGDNFLSKNIRPGTLIFLLLLFLTTVILSACKIKIDDGIMMTLRALLLLVFGAYFGDRALQKWTLNKQS